MEFDLNYEINEIYGKWLLENYPDEIRSKDSLVEAIEKGYRFDEFRKELEKGM
ncbi:MAG: hypothetical protein ACOC56_04455 [Atribacterota bacterium]